MRRGDIYYANLDPTVGAEIRKKRPVLIVSNDANNKAAATITVLPITSNIEKIYRFEVFLDKKNSGLPKSSKVQCQQIRTISKQRIDSGSIGCLSESVMKQIDLAIKLHLALI